MRRAPRSFRRRPPKTYRKKNKEGCPFFFYFAKTVDKRAEICYNQYMSYTFISGATGGIGKAFATLCARKNYDLFLTGRSEEKLAALKSELEAVNGGIKILVRACQLTDEADRAALMAYADGQGVKFERAINVAGVDIQKAFSAYTTEKAQFQIRVNVEATVTLTHRIMERGAPLKEIVTVSSMSGVTPMPYFALYSATKAALTAFFTALRLEVKKEGVKVTVVLPGGVPTRPDIVKDIEGQGLWGKLSSKSPEDVAESSLKAVRKNKAILVPGGFNKFLYFIMKLVPRGISMRFIANRWKKQTKDAF